MQASQATNETRLPRQVLKMSAAIEERLKAQREPKVDPATQSVTPAEPSAQVATPAEPQPQAQPPAPDAAADPRDNDPGYWKQRFKVMDGILRKEREAHREEVHGFHQRMTELQEQIRSLQASAPSAEPDVGQFFTPQQVEELGEDQANAIVKAAMKLAQDQVKAAVEAEIAPLREQRAREQQDAVKDLKTKFFDKLTELVPDYQEIDIDDDWKAWLAQEDEHTGVIRQEILDRHVAKADALRTAKLFKDFKMTKTAPTPPVAPRGSGAGGAGEPPVNPNAGLRPPSDQEVKDFFKRAKLGKVSDQERVQFDARLKLRAGR